MPLGLLFTYFEPLKHSTSSSVLTALKTKSPSRNVQLHTIPPFLTNALDKAVANPPDELFFRKRQTTRLG